MSLAKCQRLVSNSRITMPLLTVLVIYLAFSSVFKNRPEKERCVRGLCDLIFVQLLQSLNEKQLNKVDKFYAIQEYVILSSDLNYAFLFPMPITVLMWRRLGIDCIVIIAEAEEKIYYDLRIEFIIRVLEEMKVQMYYINSKMASTYTIAQTSRIFAAGLPNLPGNDETVLITADADMWSLHRDQHVATNRSQHKIFIYNKDSLSLRKRQRPGDIILNYREFPLNTIAMSASVWREVMEIEKNWLKDGDVLVKRLIKEFGERLISGDAGRGTQLWEIDQLFVSRNIHKWMWQDRSRETAIGGFAGPPNRLNRLHWFLYNFSLINEMEIFLLDDVHIPHDIYKNFTSVSTLLKLILNESKEWEFCRRYQKLFDQISEHVKLSPMIDKIAGVFASKVSAIL